MLEVRNNKGPKTGNCKSPEINNKLGESTSLHITFWGFFT